MPLQTKGAPNAPHRGLVQTGRFGHLPGAPMRRIRRLALQRARDHFFHLRVVNLARLTGAGRIQQTVQAQVDEPLAPFAHCLQRHVQTPGHLTVEFAMRTRQHDACAQRQRLRTLAASRPFGQAIVFFHGQRQLRQPSSSSRLISLSCLIPRVRQMERLIVQRINDSGH